MSAKSLLAAVLLTLSAVVGVTVAAQTAPGGQSSAPTASAQSTSAVSTTSDLGWS